MNSTLSPSAQKVQNVLKDLGVSLEVVELSTSTRTAQEAADSIGCEVAQIAKSLIFRTAHTSQPILIIASGINKVNESKVCEIVGEKIKRADADFVRQETGFAIGGIPPVGHINKIETLIDEDILGFKEIWAAAGTPHGVFKLTPDELVKITGGKVCSVA